jgi:hypothetical protein
MARARSRNLQKAGRRCCARLASFRRIEEKVSIAANDRANPALKTAKPVRAAAGNGASVAASA